MDVTSGLKGVEEIAKALFYFVRDDIKYRIFLDVIDFEMFKASNTLNRGFGFCIPKANLLAALARANGIPSRLHFADIRNHQLPAHIMERLFTDLMVYHGYVELFINHRWVKANPSLDIELCNKYDIIPVDFNGLEDALFHTLDRIGRLHIEYINDHGTFNDLPYDNIIKAFSNNYKIEKINPNP
jgi:transglutaminase-like putative cysteine protease